MSRRLRVGIRHSRTIAAVADESPKAITIECTRPHQDVLKYIEESMFTAHRAEDAQRDYPTCESNPQPYKVVLKIGYPTTEKFGNTEVVETSCFGEQATWGMTRENERAVGASPGDSWITRSADGFLMKYSTKYMKGKVDKGLSPATGYQKRYGGYNLACVARQ